MNYWSWWAGGLALATVCFLHFYSTKSMMAVSGRFTALVDRWRSEAPIRRPMTEAELLAALHSVTVDEFGEHAIESGEQKTALSAPPLPRQTIALSETPIATHIFFFVSLMVGGLLASLSTGNWHVSATLHSDLFEELIGKSAILQVLVLLVGGVLVGFGTRMAGGCTSGHGLCGVSRLQPGSLLATAAYFGAGIATALSLRWW